MSTQTTKLIRRVASPGKWFQIPYDTLKIASAQETILFMYLLGKSEKFHADDNDGWFYCTVKGATLEIGMSEDTQRRAMNKLKKRGWLTTCQKGLPAKRHIRLDLDKWVTDSTGIDLKTPELDPAKTPELDPAKTPDLSLYKGDVSKRESKGAPTPTKPRKSKRYTTPKTKLHKSKWTEWDEARGLELKQIMAEQDTDLVGHIYMTDEVFTENIFKVRTERNRSQAQIEEVLEWYRRNYSDAYTPKLHRMYEFAAKFGSIVEAMERQRGGGKSQSEEDAWREAEGEFEHHYYTMFPEHDHMLMENQNMVCEKLGLPPRFRYDESNNTWSEIPK